MLILMIALGGAFGAVARYGLSGWVQSFLGTTFPMGTLVVNVLGSFVLGLSLLLFESLAWSAEHSGSGASPEPRSTVALPGSGPAHESILAGGHT